MYNNNMRSRLAFTLIIFLTVANALVWSFLGVQKAYANRVYPGVWVQAQPLSGLSKDQVVDRLKPINDAMLQQKVTLQLDNQQFQPTLADLGYKVNVDKMAAAALNLGHDFDIHKFVLAVLDGSKSQTVPLEYSIDQTTFDRYLTQIGKNIIKDPQDMALSYKDGNIIVTPAMEGITLDKEALRQAITREVKPGQSATITLSTTKSQPTIIDQSQISDAQAQLAKLLAKPLTLQAEDTTSTLAPDQIYSFTYFTVKDNKLVVNIDDNKVQGALSAVAKKVDKQPVAKQVSANDNSVLQEGSDGRQLDVTDATKRISSRLNATDLDTPVVLKVDKIDRKVATISPEYVLGRFPGRYIEVDLSAQRMHLIEGNNYVKTLIISSGKWDKPTPLGTFHIQNHIPVAFSQTYKLYMPFWMAITTDGGYGLHQLPYWPDGRVEGSSHLGRPVSHGCVRMGPGDAEYVYNWAPDDTPVVIHE